MKAAIYARKSTDDSDRNEDNKSVTRQVQHAKAYAKKNGWTVDEDHTFVDDGISGAEYQNRPGFTRLLTRLKEFDILIMSESSRLGRDMTRNAYHIGDIIESDVRIFYYLTDEEEKADTPEQKIMITLRSYASEVERQKASQRARDALTRKAQQGYNTGGSVYGYDNHQIKTTNGKGEEVRSHTEYQINEEQAEVVRAIYRAYADGYGVKVIAKTLNGDPKYRHESVEYFNGARPLPPGHETKRCTGSWSPSSVHGILHRPRYEGKIPFGKYRKLYKKGTKHRIKQDEFLLVDAPDLRIVPEDLWKNVQQRIGKVRKKYVRNNDGTLWGRPETGRISKYLLSGLGHCVECEGAITVIGGTTGSPGQRKGRIYYYGCSYHQNRGTTVCANDHRVRIELIDAAVLQSIEQQVLTPEAVSYVIERAIQHIRERQRRCTPDQRRELEAELRRLARERDNLVRAIARGNPPTSIVAEIKKREVRIENLERELTEYAVPVAELRDELSAQRLQKDLHQRIARFKDLIHEDVPRARQGLRKLLDGPIRFIPVKDNGRKTYRFEGQTKVGPLFDPTYIRMASPRGFEPLLQP